MPKYLMSNGDYADQVVSEAWLVEKGYSAQIAEAIVGREKDYNWFRYATPEEVFTEFLEWNGIIGYATMILNAVDNTRDMAGEIDADDFVEEKL